MMDIVRVESYRMHASIDVVHRLDYVFHDMGWFVRIRLVGFTGIGAAYGRHSCGERDAAVDVQQGCEVGVCRFHVATAASLGPYDLSVASRRGQRSCRDFGSSVPTGGRRY